MFLEAFPDEDDPYTIANMTKALAAFQRTLLSFNTPFDEYMNGNPDALSDAANVVRAFLIRKAGMLSLHGGFNFPTV